MRCSIFSISLIFGALALSPLRAQVMQSMNYDEELRHANSLVAGTTAEDISHHVHYDLKLYDQEGHESTATYDIYRDPLLYQRVEIKAADYNLTQVDYLHDHKSWLQTSGFKPLKITDFEQAVDVPQAAIKRFANEGMSDIMQPEELEGAPLLCANDNDGTAICFNPFIHLFAYAQMFNRTIMYDQWLPIGTHSVPGNIRIFEDKKLLVEATGTVEAVDKFPPHFMQIPETPSQPDPAKAHKIVSYKPMDISQMRYGNIQIHIFVDEQGKVTKAEIVDSDDKHLEGIARKFARSLVMQPQMQNGAPVPYDTMIYLEYYPQP
ncbi:energy transducer TonB [Acidobacterium sp. S8]|uniref:energy transducer TonB n=1 Tax=Acidobacterium sp. S8 TaxID=1641854 RepID=UPI00131C6166|nr:energy transducer TonB [Acidobacterium sp. S8]